MKPNRNSIIDGIVVPVPGEHIRFTAGEYETTEKAEIKFIQSHRLFGSQITEVEKVEKVGKGTAADKTPEPTDPSEPPATE